METKMSIVEGNSTSNGGSYILLCSGRKKFKMSLDDSEDHPEECSPDYDGHSKGNDEEGHSKGNDEEYIKDNDSNENSTKENVSSNGSEYSGDEYSVNLADTKEDSDILEAVSQDSYRADHHDDDCRTEQQNCSAKQNNSSNAAEQAKMTLECEDSGKISLRIDFKNNIFQKLKTEMSQLPPEKAMIKYVITVEKVSVKVYEHNLVRTLEYCNTFPLEFQLHLGNEYKIKVMIQKYSSLDSNFTTLTSLEVCHRKVLLKGELKKLMNKAEEFEVREANGETLLVKYAYRNKPDHYFENIKNNRSNIMEVYIKDNNGDPGCPINGQIEGLFFAVRPEPSTMEISTASPFGKRRIILPIDKLIKSNTRLYFADFWCHYEKHPHYVTLVVTKPNSDPDTFCKEHLLELSLEKNPFFFCKTNSIFGPDGDQNLKFYCCREPRVEIFFTENIDLNEDYITWHTVRTLGKRGSSTPGGIPKRQQCSTCNLNSPQNVLTI